MSVVRLCIRMAAVLALRERTWAGTLVYDTRNLPLSEAMTEHQDAPWLSVYTDRDEQEGVTGRDVNAADRQLHLVVEMGIAGKVPQADGGPAVEIPASDAGYERAIDLIEMQVRRALFHDPLNPWGEFVRKMVMSIRSTDAERTGEGERGARWAARFIVFNCDTIAEPQPGIPMAPDHPVAEFLAAIRAADIEGLATVATLIEQEIIGAPLPSWQQAQSMLGLTEQGTRGIGVAPPYATPATEVTTEVIGTTPGSDKFRDTDVDKQVGRDLPEEGGPIIIVGTEQRI
ncbi:hypothetical protein [Bradyrhizobium valentinum]|uniref:Uncharacterized protein n=1 Tax=Bradyrhizobium valentinum TaxID=1518501 RepID=A0A0R3KUJ9_9BRAD|nr:hypothetical protein [Bradyrhizobium valentinum]KRQ99275.1 hypothetical protein CP49_11810 [Bradyrhizobium valentinum]